MIHVGTGYEDTPVEIISQAHLSSHLKPVPDMNEQVSEKLQPLGV